MPTTGPDLVLDEASLARLRSTVRVRVNGRTVLNHSGESYPTTPAQIQVGANPLGASSCSESLPARSSWHCRSGPWASADFERQTTKPTHRAEYLEMGLMSRKSSGTAEPRRMQWAGVVGSLLACGFVLWFYGWIVRAAISQLGNATGADGALQSAFRRVFGGATAPQEGSGAGTRPTEESLRSRAKRPVSVARWQLFSG